MEITEIRLKLMDDPNHRLQAFCSITFDHCFVIRDLKIIQGQKGPFVAMPSRKVTVRCRSCSGKNHVRARYCNDCGNPVEAIQPSMLPDHRTKLFADIAHPIHSECREWIQNQILDAFEAEVEKSRLPGYVSNYDDLLLDDDHVDYDDMSHRSLEAGRQAASAPEYHSPRELEAEEHPQQTIRIDRASAHFQTPPHRAPDRKSVRNEAWFEDDAGGFGEGLVS